MKYLLVASLLFGCGHELGDETGGEEACQPYHDTYSHTVTYCDDEATNMFIFCNPRELNTQGCVSDPVRELEDNCYSENICLED